MVLFFNRELSSDDYNGFLQKLVHSRVRIMHIKTNRPLDKYYDGIYSDFYMRKLSLLYRVTLLDLLGIPSESYEGRLRKRTEVFDKWFEETITSTGTAS